MPAKRLNFSCFTLNSLYNPRVMLSLISVKDTFLQGADDHYGTLHHSISEVAFRKRPVDGTDGNSYELHRVDIADLRRRLFAMINGSQAEAELAGVCLTAIDALRDTYGCTYSEPRHPDIESGRPWPLAVGEMTERAFGREPTPHLLSSSL
ncbi:MAG: hypothetical protein H7836_08810 [Magnetococcus sp. YQC-3]